MSTGFGNRLGCGALDCDWLDARDRLTLLSPLSIVGDSEDESSILNLFRDFVVEPPAANCGSFSGADSDE